MRAAIIPSVLKTVNGDVAALLWNSDLDFKILKAVRSDSQLLHYTITGYSYSEYGNIAYVVVVLATKEELANPRNGLFYFNLLIDPVLLSTDLTIMRWVAALKGQQELRLEIPNGNLYRSTSVITSSQLTEYVSLLEQSIQEWKPTNNVQLALAIADEQIGETIPKKIDEFFKFYENLASKSLKDQALTLLSQAVVKAHCNPTVEFLFAENKVDEIETYLSTVTVPSETELATWLADIGGDAWENLLKDWIFVSKCIERSTPDSLKVAVGLSDSGWAWRSFPGNELMLLWRQAKFYRALLGYRQWSRLTNTLDLPIDVDLHLISELGEVPDRTAFKKTSEILKLALLERSYGIEGVCTVVVGQPGFHSVSFFALDGDSRKCLFKVVVSEQHGFNACVFGVLDAARGAIEPVGHTPTAENEKVFRLLLFLVSVAYRDLIVAREVVAGKSRPAQPNRSKRKGKPNQPLQPTVITIARTRKIGKSFADPSNVVEALQRHVKFRVEHIRQLPPGWKPSQKQLELAEKYGWTLPEGYTFVSAVKQEISDVEETEMQALERKFKSLSLMQVLFGESV